MVKPPRLSQQQDQRFESDVVPDSGKTLPSFFMSDSEFESDVVPDSGKTLVSD